MYGLNNSEKKFFFEKIPVLPLKDGRVSIDNFFNKSAISWRIILIFELDRDINETILCTKFQVNRL
jgi:hypothetical protein